MTPLVNKTFVLLLMLCAALSCAAQQASDVHAALEAQAQADGRTVTLGDIAKLSGVGPDRIDELSKVQLTAAPQPGYSLHLSQREVQHLLREAGLSGVVVEGAPATTVTAVSRLFDTAQLIETARRSLAGALQNTGGTVELAQNGTLADVKLPRGEVSLRTRPINAERVRSQMVVWVDVLLDGSFYRAVPVTFLVSDVRRVWIAHADLLKGQLVACENLEMAERDTAVLASSPQSGECTNLQRRLRRKLSAGEVLLSDDLEAIPAVGEGESVTLQVMVGGVTLESKALALTDGQIGQRIAVRATLSQEPVLALVVAPGVVNVTGR